MYLYDEEKLRIIEKTRSMVLVELRKHQIKSDDFEIGMYDFVDEDDDLLGCYYLCNMRTQEVCWPIEVPSGFFSSAISSPIVGR